MNALVETRPSLPAMSPDAIAQVREWTDKARQLPQLWFTTDHLVHGGVYYRTVILPPGSLVTGVLVKCPTGLILDGEAHVYIGNAKPLHVRGRTVLPAAAGRKQAFAAVTTLSMTMCLATNAQTAAEAEAAFTDELEYLPPLADADRHRIVVTGD